MATCNGTLEFHPIADIFPLMGGEEFETFKADVAENGLGEPIWIYEGKILDGRNRYRACRELGIEPEAREWDGDGSPISFVVSRNLMRVHLDETQRSFVGARIKPLYEEEARRRQAHGMTAPGQTLSANLREASAPPESEKGKASDKAAEAVNVSTRSVESASKVLKDGTPGLVALAEAGLVSVAAAAEVADLPEDEQREVVAKGPSAVKKKAAGRRQSRASGDRGDGSSEPDAGSRWIKFLDNMSLFLVSLPRRGGIVNLTRRWSPEKVEAAIVRLQDLANAAYKCIGELQEARK